MMPGRKPSLRTPLALALAEAGVTRTDAARRLGLSRTALQDRLSGRRGRRRWVWTNEQRDRLADLLGVARDDADALILATVSP